MKYENITRAVFLKRPNRFIAEVRIGDDSKVETVHVKNTGRCRELLVPGCEVWLTLPGTPGRKTKYDLIAVRKNSGLLVNMDSQAPNKVIREWLERQDYDLIKPEYTYGDSRVDFYMERQSERSQEEVQNKECQAERHLMEVKGCTLEIDGIGYFPDAPTVRGVKHIHELIRAKEEGYEAALAFVIQMDGITEVRPNAKTHPEFASAIQAAKSAGVKILELPCHVEPDGIEIIDQT